MRLHAPLRALLCISAVAFAVPAVSLPQSGAELKKSGTAPATDTAPAKPALGFTGNAGLLLVQVKPDQTATFEEMMQKLGAAFGTTTDAALKTQGSGIKVYKAEGGFQGNALYVVVANPATPDTEYWPVHLLANMMSDEEKRNPDTQAMFKKYTDAFAGVNKLNLTPLK